MKLRAAFVSFLLMLVAACGPSPAPSAAPSFATALPNAVPVHTDVPGQPHTHLDPAQATAEMQVALVPSELVLGPNRFAVGLLDAQGRNIRDARVHFHYFDLSSASGPQLESEANAARIPTPDGVTAIFTHERTFTRAGDWGVEVQAVMPDGKAAIKRIGFKVLAESPTIKVGQQAPAVDTPTAANANNDLTKLTSATTPNPAFYQRSLKQAVISGKPTVLLFATPAFCQTRFCGPAYEITNELFARYGDKANFIHVEVFSGLPNPGAQNFQLVPAMQAFGLHTEPWIYLLKAGGVVFYRVEGLFSADEVERHIKEMLGA